MSTYPDALVCTCVHVCVYASPWPRHPRGLAFEGRVLTDWDLVPAGQCPEPAMTPFTAWDAPPAPLGDEEGQSQGTEDRAATASPHRPSCHHSGGPFSSRPPSTVSDDRSLVTALRHSTAASEQRSAMSWPGAGAMRGGDLVI